MNEKVNTMPEEQDFDEIKIVSCLHCNGTGRSGSIRKRICPKCHGFGKVKIGYIYQRTAE